MHASESADTRSAIISLFACHLSHAQASANNTTSTAAMTHSTRSRVDRDVSFPSNQRLHFPYSSRKSRKLSAPWDFSPDAKSFSISGNACRAAARASSARF